MLLIVGAKKKTACAVFFLTFDLSKAELSMYLFTLILQKEFNLTIKKPQNRYRKVLPKKIKALNDYFIMRKSKPYS